MRSIHPDAQIGKNVTIGQFVTIHADVQVGDGCFILDGAVLGRAPRTTSTMTRNLKPTGPLVLGRDCVVGCHAVLYGGSTIGERVMISDLASMREDCEIDDDAILGRNVLVMYETRVGARTRVIDGAILTGNMVIEEDVFIGPGVNSINDNRVYLSRFGLEKLEIKGPTVRRLALIGAGANLAAGVEIGEGAIVAPSAMVTRDVDAWSVAAGVPARKVREVPPEQQWKILNWVESRKLRKAS